MKDAAREIRQALEMREVAEHYGFQVSRSGFMTCLFHTGDHTASLKVYPEAGGFHCFGCGAHGSVIDFVMKLFGLDFRQAVLRINADFHLGLSMERPGRAERSMLLEQRQAERREQERREAEFQSMIAELWYWREVQEFFPPVRMGDDAYYHPLYAESVQRLPYVEYWLDDYFERGGEEHWKRSQRTQRTTT